MATLPVVAYVLVGSGVVHGVGCMSVGANGTTPVAAESQLGRLTTDLGTRYLANSVGRIVSNTAVSEASADGNRVSTGVVDCQQRVPAARPRSRR